ncbi:hypothetical protein P7K49_016626 [Saguinus oedipus]|uniref:Uncharacterized protein n=1 Tax=Saguinus oedipus TaxID=9490 RepID=A0ABQ9VD14_SAGOE|nr:hypothetical protein P7K49_016626 [Saguinus oedipus]
MVLNHLHKRSSSRFRGSQRGQCPQSSDGPGMGARDEGQGGAFGRGDVEGGRGRMATAGTYQGEETPARVLASPLQAVPRLLPRLEASPRAAARARQPALVVRSSPPPAHRPWQPPLWTPALDTERLEQL